MDSTHATDMPRTWILHTKVKVSDTWILHSKVKLSNTIQYNELPTVKYPDIIVSNIPSAFAVGINLDRVYSYKRSPQAILSELGAKPPSPVLLKTPSLHISQPGFKKNHWAQDQISKQGRPGIKLISGCADQRFFLSLLTRTHVSSWL